MSDGESQVLLLDLSTLEISKCVQVEDEDDNDGSSESTNIKVHKVNVTTNMGNTSALHNRLLCLKPVSMNGNWKVMIY